jgi:acyl-CoA thioesterase FadM
VRYGDEPEIHLGIVEMGESSVRFGFWMQNPGDERPMCIAIATTVSVVVSEMRKVPLPERFRAAFAPFVYEDGEFPEDALKGGLLTREQRGDVGQQLVDL